MINGAPAQLRSEPGSSIFQRGGEMIALVKHATDDGAPVHFLHSQEAAADIPSAFGVDPGAGAPCGAGL